MQDLHEHWYVNYCFHRLGGDENEFHVNGLTWNEETISLHAMKYDKCH